MVVPANVWDSFFGADALQVHANEITAGLITAAAIADGAIDAATFAANAITAAAINDGAIDAATFAAGAINAAAIADGAIDAATFAAGAITAAAIADAAIDNATLAADIGSTAYATNIIALAVRKVLDALNLDHLCAVATGAADMTTEVIDNSILARILGNGDTSTFVPSTDGLHAAGVDLDAILLDTGTTLDGRIPATLVSGRIDASVGAVAANAITAAAINDGAIDAATFAAGAITAAAIADAAIDNATLAADIGSTAYATNIIALAVRKVLDALNLDHLCAVVTAAADMTTEVIDNSILARILGNGDTSTFVPSTDGLHAAGVDLDAILLDTGTTLDGRIPAALVGGKMDSSVSALANDTITAASIAADAIGASELAADAANEIADATLDRANAIETGLTLRQALRIVAAACAGKVSGAGTATVVIRNAVVDGTDRIVATVDVDGNRTAVAYDLT
jgi:hypothetical protein